MDNVTQRTMAVYRALLDNKTGNTFLSPFINIVSMAIYDDPRTVYTPEELMNLVFSLYGIKIPLFPMRKIIGILISNDLLDHLSRDRYAVKDKTTFRERYSAIKRLKTDIEESYDLLINDCFEYLQDKFNYDQSKINAENLLQHFIEYQIGEINSTTSWSENILNTSPKENPQMYFIASYINEKCIGNEKESIIKKLLVGGILTESITITQTYKTKMLNNVNIIFDTPIIFHILGINSFAIKDVYKNMISKIQELGGCVSVFNRSVDEVEQILCNAETYINSPNYDYTKASYALVYYKENGKSLEDIQYDRTMLRSSLSNLGIQIISIEYKEIDTKCNASVKDIYTEIIEIYTKHNSTKDLSAHNETIQRDADSINDIYLLRGKIRPTSIFECKAIFITSNYTLAYASVEYNKKIFPNFLHGFPTCITDTLLGTTLWLSDTIALEDMSFKKLMAQVYSMFQPKEDFWNCFLNKITDLEQKGKISANQSILLRSVSVTGKLLLDTTYANLKNISEETILEVFDRLKASASQEGYEKGRINTEKEYENILKEQLENYEKKLLEKDKDYKEKLSEEKALIKVRDNIKKSRKAIKNRCKIKITVFNVLLLLLTMPYFLYSLVSIYIQKSADLTIGISIIIDLIAIIIIIGSLSKYKKYAKTGFLFRLLEALKIEKTYMLYKYIIEGLIIKREFAKKNFLANSNINEK